MQLYVRRKPYDIHFGVWVPVLVLPTTCTPHHLYNPASNNVLKAPEMPKNIQKSPKTSKKMRKFSKNAKNLENAQNAKKLHFFSSEEYAAPIFSRGRGPRWRRRPRPRRGRRRRRGRGRRRGRRRGRGLGRGQKPKLTCTGGGKRRYPFSKEVPPKQVQLGHCCNDFLRRIYQRSSARALPQRLFTTHFPTRIKNSWLLQLTRK